MEPGEDWRAEIEAMFEAPEGNAAWFSAFGGVKAAEVSFYDQSLDDGRLLITVSETVTDRNDSSECWLASK